ncbi:hypothetical protein K438DRAFT_1756148 [Mycena galopus ATCC 62051]|nr:hypothetical protein K438DRAFT_1756148 [Mycena galopus ATCC 62051]
MVPARVMLGTDRTAVSARGRPEHHIYHGYWKQGISFTHCARLFGLFICLRLSRNQNVDITFEVAKIGWYDIYFEKEIERSYRDFIVSISPELIHCSDAWACVDCGTQFAFLTSGVIQFNDELGFPATDFRIDRKIGHLQITAACEKCARIKDNATPSWAEDLNKLMTSGHRAWVFQRADWARHKTICRKIHDVVWSGGEGKKLELPFTSSEHVVENEKEERELLSTSSE